MKKKKDNNQPCIDGSETGYNDRVNTGKNYCTKKNTYKNPEIDPFIVDFKWQ